jgi:hypothetical protein
LLARSITLRGTPVDLMRWERYNLGIAP